MSLFSSYNQNLDYVHKYTYRLLYKYKYTNIFYKIKNKSNIVINIYPITSL